jgi:hypothetical protein
MLFARARTMLDAARHDEHVAVPQLHRAIAELDRKTLLG